MLHPLDPEYRGLKFGVFYDVCSQRMNLYIRQQDQYDVFNGTIRMERKEPGSLCDPAISCHAHELQPLFDALWSAGYRPAQLQDNGDVVVAKDQHIEDLRFVMKKLMEPS